MLILQIPDSLRMLLLSKVFQGSMAASSMRWRRCPSNFIINNILGGSNNEGNIDKGYQPTGPSS